MSHPPTSFPVSFHPSHYARALTGVSHAVPVGFERVRSQLAQACQAPHDLQMWQGVEQSFSQLINENGADPVRAALGEELMAAMAWATLKQQDWRKASAWLARLDACEAGLSALTRTARVSLRWELLSSLLEARNLEAFVKESQPFLASLQPSVPQDLAAAFRTFDVIYTQVSPSTCEQSIAQAGAELLKQPFVQAAQIVSRCPGAFHSEAEVRAWAGRLDPHCLNFSKTMKADALLVHARAAEWAGDWRGMYVYVAAAVAEAPDHTAARYWMARTKLHLASGFAGAGFEMDTLPDTPAWQRLRLQIQLHATRRLEHAEALLPLLSAAREQLDPPERKLAITLLKHALDHSPVSTASDIAQRARFCHEIERVIGRQPWSQTNIAVQELHTGQYEAARQRLEAADVLKEARGALLARVARVLSGASPGGQDLPNATAEEACLTTFERVLQFLLRPAGEGQAPEPTALAQELTQARKSLLCREFPVLDVVAVVLHKALDVLRAAPPLAQDAEWAEPHFAEKCPTWAVWLETRARLLGAGAAANALLATPMKGGFALAWQLEGWWALYGSPVGEVPEPVQQSRRNLATTIAGWSAARQGFFSSLRQARAIFLCQAETIQDKPAKEIDLWDIGELGAAVCLDEAEFEGEFIRLRQALREYGAQTPAGARALEEWSELFVLLPPLSQAWWKPTLDYWTAATRVMDDPSAARALWNGLLNGPKALEARAQLALLAIKEHELASAENWLVGTPPLFPSLLYAHALLQGRSGEAQAARQTLAALETSFGASGSPYLRAARRLDAALAERAGCLDEAAQIHQATLQAYPKDPLTAARLSRIQLRAAYEQVEEAQLSRPGETLMDLLALAAPVTWSHAYRALARLLTTSEPELSNLCRELRPRLETPAGAAWRQMMARRFLQARQPAEAWQLLKQYPPAVAHVWQQPTYLVLNTWRLLSSFWQPVPARGSDKVEAKLRGCAERLALLSPPLENGTGADEALPRWLFLAQQALNGEWETAQPIPAESWHSLSPWPLAQVPALWAENAEVQAQAAQAVAAALTAATAWTDEQRQLLQALASYCGGAEDSFLEQVEQLEPRLAQLPVEPVNFWLAAAQHWFRRRNWKKLLEGDLPEAIADLAHPQAQLLIGLAYAGAAAEESLNGDVRRAQQKVRQARATLAPLLES